MSLLFMDGFDAQDTATKWSQLAWASDYSPPTRFGVGSCFKSSATGVGVNIMAAPVTPSARLYVGFAAYNVGSASGIMCSLVADSGSVEHARLSVTAAGALTLGRGATVLATSAAGVIAVGAWQYIEFSATVSDTVGVMEAKVNGVVAVTYTGDTKNGGVSTNLDTVQLAFRGGSGYGYPVDDVYVCNGLGSTNNTYLGDVRVQTLRPNAAGSSTQLAPVGLGSNYANVDETPPSQADYNYSGTAGQKDLYAVEELLGGTASVLGVQVGSVARKTDAGARGVKNLIKSGATTTASASNSLSVGAITYLTMYETNPTTAAAWAVSDIPALEVGVEVV